jgi:acyl-CoA dehydrogenase
MNFGFSEEQELLRDQARRFISDKCPTTKTREIMKTEAGFDQELWQQMADLGWLALIIPEEYGGLGMSWVDLTVLLEETGRTLSPLPLISHSMAATALARLATEKAKEYLPKLADGSVIGTLALFDEPNWIDAEAVTLEVLNGKLNGVKHFVPDAAAASLFVLAVKDGDSLALALVEKDNPGISVTLEPIMDKTKRLGTVTFSDVDLAGSVFPISNADLTYLVDCGAVAVTAEIIGAAEACMAMTTAYAKERVQFGELIGKFQGIKHRLADMYVDLESFKSLLYYAAWTVDNAPEELSLSISYAKGYASDAFIGIGIDGVGLHGAIGFTEEYDVQLYLKRSKWARVNYGDSDYHYERIAKLGGL